MKKIILVLMLLPLFVGCNNDDDKVEKAKEDTAWKEKTYNIRIKVTNKPDGVYYYDSKSKERQEQIGLNDVRDYVVYNVKPTEEEVSFVIFEGNMDNYREKFNEPKFTARFYVDDVFIAEGTGEYDNDETDVLRFVYNFKTKKVVVKHDRRKIY